MAPMSKDQLNQLRHAHLDTLVRVREANVTVLEEKFRTSEVSVIYDLEDDLLAIMLNKQQEALTIDIDEGIYFRVDPDTYVIVGIEVWHPRERLAEDSPISRIMAKALAAGSRVTIARPMAASSTSFAEDVRDLVSA